MAVSQVQPTLCESAYEFIGVIIQANRLTTRMHQYNQSLAYDQRMYAADVKGSIAFSKALQKAGIVSGSEQAEIERGLRIVEQEWQEGKVCRLFEKGHVVPPPKRSFCSSSSTSKPTTRTSTLPMNVDYPRSLAKTSAASSTPGEAGTIKSQLT